MSNVPLIELNSIGSMDCELTNKLSSYFEFNYDKKKKNRYSKGDFDFYPSGHVNWGNTVRVNIEKKGDLLYGLYVVLKLPKLSISNILGIPLQNENDPFSLYRVKYADYVGNVVIDKVSLYINDQLIDEQYGDYMQVYIDLYLSDINRKTMIGLDPILNTPNLKIQSQYIYIPLKFWFCQYPEKALPVISLKYSNIYVDIKFRNFTYCYSILKYNDTRKTLYHTDYELKEDIIEDVYVLASFYFLPPEQRLQLAQQTFEIPITQSQYRSTMMYSNTVSLNLNFNHIIKDIVFFIQPEKNKQYGEYFNFSNKMNYLPSELLSSNVNDTLWKLEPMYHLLHKGRILFNGLEKTKWRDYKYFYCMQNHENYKANVRHYIYMYSFNVNPIKDQTFVGCNFSELNDIQLQIEIKPYDFVVSFEDNIIYSASKNYELKCFATNYNIMVIKNGLSSLKY